MRNIQPESFSQVALLLLEFLALDLASCVALFQDVERGLLPLALPASAGTHGASHQHHDAGNQQSPKQQHPHTASPTVVTHMSPHFFLLARPCNGLKFYAAQSQRVGNDRHRTETHRGGGNNRRSEERRVGKEGRSRGSPYH